jgi:squalene-hopene/tetraprenyl-beta-curcumene cyclase
LLAGGDTRSISLHKAVEYLLENQRPDGNWDEEYATGTGFPRVFYLTYSDYRNTFPILALATFAKAKTPSREDY